MGLEIENKLAEKIKPSSKGQCRSGMDLVDIILLLLGKEFWGVPGHRGDRC